MNFPSIVASRKYLLAKFSTYTVDKHLLQEGLWSKLLTRGDLQLCYFAEGRSPGAIQHNCSHRGTIVLTRDSNEDRMFDYICDSSIHCSLISSKNSRTVKQFDCFFFATRGNGCVQRGLFTQNIVFTVHCACLKLKRGVIVQIIYALEKALRIEKSVNKNISSPKSRNCLCPFWPIMTKESNWHIDYFEFNGSLA